MSFKLTGVGAMKAKIAALAASAPMIAERALYREASIVLLPKMQDRTPVKFGILRASGFVEKPTRRGRTIVVYISFGGPAAPYAWIVHEDLDAHHNVGQAKFAESVLNEEENNIPTRVMRDILAGLHA